MDHPIEYFHQLVAEDEYQLQEYDHDTIFVKLLDSDLYLFVSFLANALRPSLITTERHTADPRIENGIHHSKDDIPARIVAQVGLRSETWYHEGQLHRVAGPADILYLSDDEREENWWFNGRPGRLSDGLCATQYYGQNRIIEPYIAPNEIGIEVFTTHYYEDDVVIKTTISYYRHCLHNPNGPAIFLYDGNRVHRHYYLNGNRVPKKCLAEN